MIQLDHIAVSGMTLDEAVGHVEEALGVPLGAGGKHEVFGTHNRLIGLADGLYLEAIAIDPDAPRPERARWFDLDRFAGAPRLTNWICRTENLAATLEDMPSGAGSPVALTRANLRWLMAVSEAGSLPYDGVFPALLEWQVPTPPGDSLAGSGCRLTRLEVSHPDADALCEILSMTDDRLAFVRGAPGLSASFDTPHGVRVLE